MNSAVPDRLLAGLGRTESGPEVLRMLVEDQHTRRLLLFRALLDAVRDAPRDALPQHVRDRVHRHWSLLEAADGADRATARKVLFYPLVGPWLHRCLRGLAALSENAGVPARAGTPEGRTELLRELGHLGSLAVAAAARTGVPFALQLPVHGGRLGLPTLGVLRCGSPAVGITGRGGDTGLTLTPAPGRETPADVRPWEHGSWWSPNPRWIPLHRLPGGPGSVLLDDLDPFRTADSGLDRHGLGATGALTLEQRAGWDAVWRGVRAELRVGGEGRALEAERLLHCLVPLVRPPGASPSTAGAAHCSGTRREAFGAVLSSVPDTPSALAATLVHELQHAKLAALTDRVVLHRADGRARYWAPWRPDPRPFDGLLQGTYAHLGLADYWHRCALSTTDAARRDGAWAEHSRCHAQVSATLPALRGSRSLTPAGRALVEGMVARHAELRERPPPKGHLARAAAYVETARTMWRRQRTG
ncbi:HEXXH motif-containing putative peptide modification protein [Streptomyces sp. Ru87]|uniref:aKG-HExxH-type peptide beta-hydroxylase n=1 Tax=Streptomyces sp. Ru87 TaxID=2044307 RepID=UPI000BFA8264|nr:HEXXH motif-containing putative peptide modification protein [Streptomyces sp. Ru87]PGH52286.1 HEXXH motif domain-containing protein [Streptomyces sp. Ru87]